LRDNALVGQTTASGSGFVYDNQGHIVTNDHVIKGHKVVDVEFADGNTFKAKVVGIDLSTDLAVLQIVDDFSTERLVPSTLGNSSLLQVGQEVAAIGNPFGLQNLMTQGIISGLRVLLPTNQTDFSIPDVIVTDVPLNPGNSGGPLLNMRGEIIGINTAIAYTNQFSELSYSISSNIIKKIVPQLIAHGTYIHPWLGVTGYSLSSDVERSSGLPTNYKGVIITSVQTGSPAAKVNLQPTTVKHKGDIIIAIDGHPVKHFKDIINYLESTKSVGNTITVRFLRNGTVKNVDIQLIANPNVEKENIKITTLPTLGKVAIKDWTKIIGLSDNNVTSQGPRLAASGNNVYAVWEESHDGINRIIFAKSTNQGNTFSKPANLTSGIRVDSETPSIAAFGNIVYVVWSDNLPGNYNIFFIKSIDGGNNFSKPLNLSNDPGLSYQPRIVTDGKNGVYVVWTDNSPGNYDILFTKSSDGGDSFDKPIILSNLKGVSNFPNIAASGNDTVYVVWSHKNNTDFDPSNTENQTQTYNVFFTKSIDRGNSFSKPINLSDDTANSQSPALAISEMGTVYVVWSDNSIGTYETFFTKSLDRGHTFSKVSVISSNLARSISPSIAAYGNNVYLVWSDNAFGNSEIFFTNSIDNGSTYNIPININEDAGTSGVAQIAIDPGAGNLYLIWQDNATGNNVIYFTKSRLTSFLPFSLSDPNITSRFSSKLW
ncbi:MAG TPA: trypsin-like peptidase domain-containing protein, partial [Candidatus Eisenbacteria bacterium]|nr:trypsin-like peptidase domain-containing protein [Candidatus Eisenbacteria bacterium]